MRGLEGQLFSMFTEICRAVDQLARPPPLQTTSPTRRVRSSASAVRRLGSDETLTGGFTR
jgi:hypothetical protein